MGHSHEHNNSTQQKLLISIILNFGITLIQIVGGILSNSLSLLSDSLHNLGDSIALLLAYISGNISKKNATTRRTFGYKRIEIISALFNASALIAICIFLIFEAYHRFVNPEIIKADIMLVVAISGLVANLLSVIILNKDKNSTLNIKAAYLHLLGDTFSSIAVIIGGVAIYYYEIWWIDPIITAAIAIYIIIHTYHVLKETIDILMHKVPDYINIEVIRELLKTIKEIKDIHHVHVWSLTESNIFFESHIDLKDDLNISETSQIKTNIENLLNDKYQINHVTLQFEYKGCNNNSFISDK